jgi:hypothetical protein
LVFTIYTVEKTPTPSHLETTKMTQLKRKQYRPLYLNGYQAYPTILNFNINILSNSKNIFL